MQGVHVHARTHCAGGRADHGACIHTVVAHAAQVDAHRIDAVGVVNHRFVQIGCTAGGLICANQCFSRGGYTANHVGADIFFHHHHQAVGGACQGVRRCELSVAAVAGRVLSPERTVRKEHAVTGDTLDRQRVREADVGGHVVDAGLVQNQAAAHVGGIGHDVVRPAEVHHLDVFERDGEQAGVGQVGVDIARDQGVGPCAAEDRGVGSVKNEHIVARAAFQRVGAFGAPQGVVAFVALEPVDPG